MSNTHESVEIDLLIRFIKTRISDVKSSNDDTAIKSAKINCYKDILEIIDLLNE